MLYNSIRELFIRYWSIIIIIILSDISKTLGGMRCSKSPYWALKLDSSLFFRFQYLDDWRLEEKNLLLLLDRIDGKDKNGELKQNDDAFNEIIIIIIRQTLAAAAQTHSRHTFLFYLGWPDQTRTEIIWQQNARNIGFD